MFGCLRMCSAVNLLYLINNFTSVLLIMSESAHPGQPGKTDFIGIQLPA